MKDYYEILGVSKNASKDEIKRAYRKLAHQHHPDKNGGSDDKFKEINEAYQILSDDRKRQQYDQFGSTYSQQGAPDWGFGGFGGAGAPEWGDLGDIFEDLFGGFGGAARGRRARGSDISIEIDISFAESVFGGSRNVIIEKNSACEPCRGTGAEHGTSLKTCTVCQGSGTVRESRRSIFGSFTSLRTCTVCGGKGEVPERPCKQCGGKGVTHKQEGININIPAGIRSGEAIKLTGIGEAIPGGSSGDLYVRIRVLPHPIFGRSGTDLTMELSLPLTKLMLGCEESIDTLDGKIVLQIPELSKTGDILRVRGKGIPKGRGGRGDLLITLKAKLPKKLSHNVKKLLSDLEKEGL
ncbi:molecular chaperone DnaJ [Candidatus Giovannonibacteria bacterium]|nr:molecular chaperone DnaJ [Candidatus Giovannonibacteria bacterium]